MTGGPRRGRRPSSRPPAYRAAVAATEPAAPGIATASAAAATSKLEVAADRHSSTAAAARLEAAQEERPLRSSQGRLLLQEALIRVPGSRNVCVQETAGRAGRATSELAALASAAVPGDIPRGQSKQRLRGLLLGSAQRA